MAASKREFGECWNEQLVIKILPPHPTFRIRNFLSEPAELPLLSRHKPQPCMLVEKPATRIKIAITRPHFLGVGFAASGQGVEDCLKGVCAF